MKFSGTVEAHLAEAASVCLYGVRGVNDLVPPPVLAAQDS